MYTNVKVCIEDMTGYYVCLAVGEFLFSQRSVWVPRTLIKDGDAVDYKDRFLDIDSTFVHRYKITDY